MNMTSETPKKRPKYKEIEEKTARQAKTASKSIQNEENATIFTSMSTTREDRHYESKGSNNGNTVFSSTR